MHGEHGIADTCEEPAGDYGARESTAPLGDEVKTGPNEHIGIVDDNPSRTRAIESDARFDVVRDCDRGCSGARRLTRYRKHCDAWCSIRRRSTAMMTQGRALRPSTWPPTSSSAHRKW